MNSANSDRLLCVSLSFDEQKSGCSKYPFCSFVLQHVLQQLLPSLSAIGAIAFSYCMTSEAVAARRPKSQVSKRSQAEIARRMHRNASSDDV